MQYIYNQKTEIIGFDEDDLSLVLVVKDVDLIKNEQFLRDFNRNIHDIYLENAKNSFYAEHKEKFDKSVLTALLQTKTENIRNNILSKFMLGMNLHFLLSNGCSMYAGSKAINQLEESQHSKLVKEFKLSKYKSIQKTINGLENSRPEVALDRLYEILSYCTNVLGDQNTAIKVECLVNDYKKLFVNNFVLTIDSRIIYIKFF